ncbi:MAG: ATP synthase F1 subunit gamma [Chloroflexi bacterium]|nr:ATP synthase F1 subunit gamma [Chloroflexota bacterium]
MASVRDIRRRIKSVRNTAKITKAMEMIAASKMRRAQQRTLASRPYAQKMRAVVSHLTGQAGDGEDTHPLLQRREVKNILLVHITPDRGLTGGLNGNLNRRAAQHILEEKRSMTVITVGKKSRDFMIRHGQKVKAVFTDMSDKASIINILPITKLIVDDYTSGAVDRVDIIYADFISTMVQKPAVRQLLPIAPDAASMEGEGETADQTAVGKLGVDYIYEPARADLLNDLLPRYVDMQVYQALLEAIASEQSARMVAMRNATENALEMIGGLTLELNKARQGSITNELLDIVGGVAALEG